MKLEDLKVWLEKQLESCNVLEGYLYAISAKDAKPYFQECISMVDYHLEINEILKSINVDKSLNAVLKPRPKD